MNNFLVLYPLEYTSIFVFLIISLGLALVILGASYFLAVQLPDVEKVSAYECGFDPYEDSRNNFEVRFFLIAILFLLFDIEAVFLFPWASSFCFMTTSTWYIGVDFILELLLGFLYAWRIGALMWE